MDIPITTTRTGKIDEWQQEEDWSLVAVDFKTFQMWASFRNAFIRREFQHDQDMIDKPARTILRRSI